MQGGRLRYGTVFKINTDGTGYQILWNFLGYQNGDGENPESGLIEGSDGALYGTTFFGGAAIGTVFRLSKDGTGYSVLKSFQRWGVEGAGPSGVIEGTNGEFYGSTALGGKQGPSGDLSESYGTIFVLRRAVSILGVSV